MQTRSGSVWMFHCVFSISWSKELRKCNSKNDKEKIARREIPLAHSQKRVSF